MKFIEARVEHALAGGDGLAVCIESLCSVYIPRTVFQRAELEVGEYAYCRVINDKKNRNQFFAIWAVATEEVRPNSQSVQLSGQKVKLIYFTDRETGELLFDDVFVEKWQ